jgi:hypothetical protein
MTNPTHAATGVDQYPPRRPPDSRPAVLALRVTGRMPAGTLPDRNQPGMFAVDVMRGDECVGQLAVASVQHEQSADGKLVLTIRMPFDYTIDVTNKPTRL